MMCVISSYLDEQRIACLRIAKAANEGTQAQQEWLKNAQVLIDRAVEHKAACTKCKQK